jgi:hypothetical protein
MMRQTRHPPHPVRKCLACHGPDARRPGTYAANCLLARRLAERGVRFIQLFHRGWDQHGDLPKAIANQCRDTDQLTYKFQGRHFRLTDVHGSVVKKSWREDSVPKATP